jgi:hypothetical protein
MPSKITIAEFKKRLAALCLTGRGFPRKDRDQQILFRSVTMMLETGRDYTEQEVNEGLAGWLSQMGHSVEIDHVTLRRYLVDAGYLVRDPVGSRYRVDEDQPAGLFESGIEAVDPVAVVEAAYREAEERKRVYLEQRDSEPGGSE